MADSDRSKEFIEAASSSASHTNNLALTFLATLAYVGISVAAVSDEVLLMGRNIQLPLLNAQIAIESFFFLAPTLLVVMHMHLLLQRHLLVQILLDEHLQEVRDDTRLIFPLLLANLRPAGRAYVIPLLGLLSRIVYVVMPLGVLLWIQFKFLPHHSPLTMWHQLLVLADLTLLWYFLGGEYVVYKSAFPRLSPIRQTFPIATTFLVAFVSVFLLAGSGNGAEVRMGRRLFAAEWVRHHLDLSGETLVIQEPPAEVVATYPSLDEALRRHGKGIRVSGRDMREADLSNAVLVNADLRGVDLTGARLGEADLRGAILGGQGGRSARLRRAMLVKANLAGAKLASVDLRLADLREAKLAMADLRGADLREARLENADLRGALLDGSRMDLSRLQGAKLSGASLEKASLVGADFYRATLVGVYLRKAQLLGARFHGAELFGADFRGAYVIGAEFRNAHLQGALGLSLHGLNLQQAHVNQLFSCEDDPDVANSTLEDYPTIVDFRGAELKGQVNWGRLKRSMEDELEQVSQTAGVSPESQTAAAMALALQRVVHAQRRTTCLGRGPGPLPSGHRASSSDLKLLHHPGQFEIQISWWPKSIKERQFQFALARLLKDQSCSEPNLARSLVRKLANCYEPADAAPQTLVAQSLWAELQKPVEEICVGLRPLSSEEREAIRTIAEGEEDSDLLNEVCT